MSSILRKQFMDRDSDQEICSGIISTTKGNPVSTPKGPWASKMLTATHMDNTIRMIRRGLG